MPSSPFRISLAFRTRLGVPEMRASKNEGAAIICQSDRIGLDCLRENLLAGDSAGKLGDPVALEEVEERHIRRVLARAISLQEAADILGID